MNNKGKLGHAFYENEFYETLCKYDGLSSHVHTSSMIKACEAQAKKELQLAGNGIRK